MCAKKLNVTNKIAVAVATVAVAGSFGTGVYAAVQGTPEFDAKGFTSSYDKSAQDDQKGFKATPASSDAMANRHKDDANNDEKSAQSSPQQDAFSNLPDNGSGSTGVSVDPNAKPGTATSTDDGNGTGDGNNGGASGPAADDSNGGNPGGGSDNPGGGDNPSGGDNSGGNTDNPSGGDNPGGGNNPGGGDKPSGDNDKPGGGDKPSVNPGDGDNGAIDVPQKPEEDRGNTENPFTPEKDQVGDDSFYKPAGSGPSSDVVYYLPNVAVKEGCEPCVGEKVSSWDLFCSLDTVYFYWADFSSDSFMWSCANEEAYKNYDLFKVTGISYQDPDDPKVTKTIYFKDQDKITIPDCSFDILFTYKFTANDAPTESSLFKITWEECTPAYARVYLVQEEKTKAGDDDSGRLRPTQKVVQSYTIASKDECLNFFAQAKTLLEGEGAVGDPVNGDINILPISKLITGFYDTDTNEAVDGAGGYSPTPGYHTVAATFDDVAEGTTACLKSEYDDLFGKTSYYYAQVLTHVDASVVKDGAFTVQRGIHAVQADATCAVKTLVLPDTVMRIGDPLIASVGWARLAATDNYVVDPANKRLESIDGCIIDHQTDALVAIPGNKETVTVPDGIAMVNLPAINRLKLIELETSSANALPDFTFNNLDESCIVEVPTNDLLEAAQEKYAVLLQNGNVIRSKEGVSKKYIDDMSMSMEDDKLVGVPDNGATAITLYNIKSIGAGAFADNKSVTTIFLKGIGDCAFEPGCFNGGALKTIVCESDAQAELVRASLSAPKNPEETPAETPSGDGSVAVQSADGLADEPTTDGLEGTPAEESSIEVLSVEHAKTTVDGNFEYLDADNGTVVLLKALNDNVSEFTGVLDNGEHVDVIGPEAFAGKRSLRYLNLDASVTAIGQKAFDGCSGLREVFVDTRDSITFGAKPFYACNNIEIFASNAKTAIGNAGTFLSDSCSAWALLDSDGYDNHFGCFDADANITSYEAAEQSDGSFVLYGCTGDDNPWLCIAAPSELPAEVALPTETVEIFSEVFAGAKGPAVTVPPADEGGTTEPGDGDTSDDKPAGGNGSDSANAGDAAAQSLNDGEEPSGEQSGAETETSGESGSANDDQAGGEGSAGDQGGSSAEEEIFVPTNPFTIDFGKLDNLLYVDESAFDNSALAGDIYFGERGDNTLHFSRSAFNNCKNITSFTCDALHLDAGETSLAGCSHMKTVKLACEKYTHADIRAAVFAGCASLESIEFTAETDPVELTKAGDGNPFRFMFEDHEDKVKIIVPDDMKEAYLKSWVYSFTRYDDYDQLLETAEIDLKIDTENPCPNPTDAQIVQKANELLLADENYLRARMGMDEVKETTLPHRVVTDSGISLWLDGSRQAVVVKAAPGTESIDFNSDEFSAWDEIVLQEGAFANAGEALKTITLSDRIKVIKKDTFAGCKDITLNLASAAPMLHGGEKDNAFTFGAEKLTIVASDEVRTECLREWPRQMLGLDSDLALDDFAFDTYIQLFDWESGEEPLKTDVSKAVNDILAAQENTVRSWFGMDPLAEGASPAWVYVSTIGADSKPAEDPKEETPVEPGGNTGGETGSTGGETGNVDDGTGDTGNGESKANPPTTDGNSEGSNPESSAEDNEQGAPEESL